MQFTYDYPRASVTVDIAVFCHFADNLKILLIKRGRPPYEGTWALPGGFIEMEETLVQSAYRELAEETGLKDVDLKQFKTYGDPGRDPRGRTISVVFYGFISPKFSFATGGDDASEAEWFSVFNFPPLAFDHPKILNELLLHLKIF
ncbi:MAG: NUDIX hydrolase [Sphingobacteriia bacterium]|nr:NUDIX hydrolase [Sphingobacteriia bacterium]